MPDKLADILKNDLVVENNSLRDLMFETLDLCQQPGGPDRAIRKLDAKRKKFSSGIDFLKKVPYCCLFLSYACFKREYYSHAVRWIRVANDGLDQLNQVWNRSIARWICALIYQQSGYPEDAEIFFGDAIKLMEQELRDRKRRSHYEKAEECEIVLERLHEDARLLEESVLVHLPAPALTGDTQTIEDILLQNLLSKVFEDRETAERLINFERTSSPQASRVDLIRSAIERWERNNQ